jgi:hypothetical protein
MSTIKALTAVTAALAVCGCLPAVSAASESVQLQTSFTPDKLGASTTIGFGFQISDPAGGLPPPLTSLSLRLPPGINYIMTTLGLATCNPATLVAQGLDGCPPNSRLGSGSAFVEVPFGTGSGREIPDIQAVMGPSHNGNIVVLFYANGQEPVFAQLVFEGELISGSSALGGSLTAAIPLIPSVPNGPPVSIVSVQATIGPNHLTYYEHVHGRTVSFHPKGVGVPSHCPRGGFQFSANFSFADGSTATAQSTVPCPRRRT